MRLVLGVTRHIDLHRILEVYVAALTGFSHVHHLDSLNTTLLSRGRVLEYGSHCMDTGRAYVPRTVEEG